MHRIQKHIIELAIRTLVLALTLTGLIPAHAQESHWLTGYYAIYDQNGVMTPEQVDMTKLTHIVYWGVEPTSTGGLNTTKYVSAATFASGATIIVANAHAAGAKALIGIGGDEANGYSQAFNQATTPANLPTFVANIVSLMQQYGFDGVDINWEQIGAYTGDNTQFPAFIGALRTKLNSLTPVPLLTMSPEVKGNGGRPDLIGPIQQDFDQINLQTYLMSGPYCYWETWHNSPYSNNNQNFLLAPSEALPSVVNSVADYETAGVPMGKLGMGIQFGGLEWDGGSGTSTGGATEPLQTWTSDGSNQYCSATNPSAPTLNYPLYTSLAPLAAGAPANNYTLNYDSIADQRWLSYDPSGTGTTNEAKDKFISFDDPTSIAKKGTDLSAGPGQGGTMGGVMLFELSGDFFPNSPAAQQHPLLNAAHGMQSLLPGLIINLKATPGTTTATLAWTAASFATSYNVYTGSSASGTPTSVTAPTISLSNLNPGQQYEYFVQAVDAFGASTGSTVTFQMPAASTIPTGLIATPGVLQVTLTWKTVAGATGYLVKGRISTTSNYGSAVSAKSPFVVTKLTAGDTYYFEVASQGSWGTSSYSSAVSAKPFAPLPAPTGLAATTAPGVVNLSWKAVTGATSYQVWYKTNSASTYSYSKLGTSTTNSYKYTANFNGTTTYYFAVSSINGSYISPDSTQVSAKPPIPVPPAPGTPSAVAGSNQVKLTWIAVTGASGYYVLRSTTSGTGYTKLTTGSITSPTYTDTTAYDGITYYYVVEAYNSSGASGNSPQISTTPSISAPTGLTDTVSNNVVTLNWTGVAGVTGYEALRGTTAGGSYTAVVGTVSAPTVTMNDTTAIPGVAYYYVVRAYFLPGQNKPAVFSPPSNQIQVTVNATKLASPTGLAAYLAQDLTSVNLDWNKEAGATSFNILRSTANGSGYSLVGTSPYALFTDSTVAPGTTYYYVVQAVNAAGNSGYSNQASIAVPKATIPATPIFTITVQNGVVNLLQLDGIPGATAYQFYRSTSATGTYTQLYSGPNLTYADKTATPGVTYYYKLTASNTAGTSPSSAAQSAVVPLTPTGVKAVAGNGEVALTWTAVSGAFGYNVYRGTSSTNLDVWVGSPTTNSVSDTTVSNGVTYYYGVQTIAADQVTTGAFSAPVSATPMQAAPNRVVWIPDYYGQLLQVRVGTTNPTAITIDLPSCNPNSVAVNSNKAYVVCNANGANPDKILVYNAATIRAAPAGILTISPLQTITSGEFSSLIGITFDASNNLWVASYGNNQVDEITATQLAATTPAVTVSLISSPPSPVALAFDKNGSLWVTGQYDGGILLNFPSTQLGLGENAVPDYCLATSNLGAGCQYVDGVFLGPEGLALFNGDVWVANNSTGPAGNVPGRELVDLKYSGGSATTMGTLTLNATFGNSAVAADSPFVCPGGLFAGSVHLWVNDESYGEANPECGAAGDVASKTGGVFDFTSAQLTAETTTVTQVLAYSNITGRPGFGGIFVENDQ
jgi:GH18 family chitinase/fibronectin type 3 domain-containing protein